MTRRGLLGLLGVLALRMPPQPAGYVPPSLPGQAAGGSAGLVRARQVIVFGANSGVFVYNGTPGPGNQPITSDTNQATDPYGNPVQLGVTSYGNANLWAQLISGSLNLQAAAGQAQLSTVTQQNEAELLIGSGSVAGGTQALLQLQASDSVDGAGTAKAILQADQVTLTAPTVSTSATTISCAGATIDIHNGNVNLNMARPPNYAAVVAGTATAAQVEACLGGLLTSLTNRQLMA